VRFSGVDGNRRAFERREECNVISRLCRVVFAAALLVAVGGTMSSVQAQGLTGQISGTVTDSGGGVLPGATVVLKNAGTNATRETVTGSDGAFQFPDLLAGKYDITVTVSGFKTYEQKGISLSATATCQFCRPVPRRVEAARPERRRRNPWEATRDLGDIGDIRAHASVWSHRTRYEAEQATDQEAGYAVAAASRRSRSRRRCRLR